MTPLGVLSSASLFTCELARDTSSTPSSTTAELAIDVGDPAPATEIPLVAALVRGTRATVYRADGAQARKESYAVLGERQGRLFVEPRLRAGTAVVTEGQAGLKDGDRIEAKVETPGEPLQVARGAP